jgi:hypothetical protein
VFEPVERKLAESLWSVSASVEVFLRPVFRLKRPETVEDTVPLDCTEGARTESLRWGPEKEVSQLEVKSINYTCSGERADDLDREWALGDSPEGSLNCRVARIGFAEATDIRRR